MEVELDNPETDELSNMHSFAEKIMSLQQLKTGMKLFEEKKFPDSIRCFCRALEHSSKWKGEILPKLAIMVEKEPELFQNLSSLVRNNWGRMILKRQTA